MRKFRAHGIEPSGADGDVITTQGGNVVWASPPQATGDATWTSAGTLSNGWSNYLNGYGSAAYRKDGQGFVHLRGVITGGTTAAVAFTLPAGYRPGAKTLHPAGSNGTVMGRIDVLTTGGVEIRGNGTVISLDGVTFLAEA